MKEDKKFEVLLWAFYTHWLWNEQYILISWIFPTGDVNMYRIFNSYWYEETKINLWKYDKLLDNLELIDKIRTSSKQWINLEWLRKWEIPHPKGWAHFYYTINVGPTIIDYCLWNKIITFNLLEEKEWYQLSYKLRNSTFKAKNFRGETVDASLYGWAKWFPHKIFYEGLSRIYSKEHGLSSEIIKWWFEDIENISTMDDVLNYIEKTIKRYDKNDISYWDWSKEYMDNELPF